MLSYICQIIMLLGAFQGFIFSGFAFFSKKYKSKSNFFLGMLILTFSYNIFQNYLYVSGYFPENLYFEVFYIPFSSLFLVLFFLYVRTFLRPDRKFPKLVWLLFLPFLINFIESIIEKLGFAFIFFNNSHIEFFDVFRIIFEIFNVAFSFGLIVCSYIFIEKFESKQSDFRNRRPKIGLNWLKNITIALFCLCLYWIIPLYFAIFYGPDTAENYFYILWVGLAITIYVLGHIGLYQFGIVQEQINIHNFSINYNNPVPVLIKSTDNKNIHLDEFESFVKTGKKYLDQNISLEAVALELSINKSYLSRLINTELGKSFSEFVNELRIDEAKEFLTNPKFENYTLVSIGLEAGFSSKSSFNSIFKKYTGLTPSEFKKSFNEQNSK